MSSLLLRRRQGGGGSVWERHSPGALLVLITLLSCCGFGSSGRSLPIISFAAAAAAAATHATPVDNNISFFEQRPVTDAVIVGSGLAGLTAALHILDRGGTVVVVEKEPILGGNSNKASSGINACCYEDGDIALLTRATNDTLDLFHQDTLASAGDAVDPALVVTLVRKSAYTVKWLRERVGVDLSAPLAQLGGHSRKRTHRPTTGFVGAELMNAMQMAIQGYESRGYARILTKTRVTQVVKDSEGIARGVQIQTEDDEASMLLRSDTVILATGGYASDRSEGSLLRQYRPELQNMPATAGLYSTGDGIHLARELGAGTRDMDKIQVHPTGFVDPADPTSAHKVLAAELLRGVGGILLNHDGLRFCNELGYRDYITDKMLEHDANYRESRVWNPESPLPTFYLLMSSEAAKKSQKHMDTYLRKGLMKKYFGLESLAASLDVPLETLTATIQDYQSVAAGNSTDPFGRADFDSVFADDLASEEFYFGEVTPVLHYCMGGLRINAMGEVLNDDGSKIPGLYAAGEVAGGVHGNNRLGGNSLLECAVFGSIVGKSVHVLGYMDLNARRTNFFSSHATKPQKNFTLGELAEHSTPEDCFVGLHGDVYDLTTFIEQHPGGKTSISTICGIDATDIFAGVHSPNVLAIVDRRVVGQFGDRSTQTASDSRVNRRELQPITKRDVELHNSGEDCWVVIHGGVYNLTQFSEEHPGGDIIIQKMAGIDATALFERFHFKDRLRMARPYLVGIFSEGG